MNAKKETTIKNVYMSTTQCRNTDRHFAVSTTHWDNLNKLGSDGRVIVYRNLKKLDVSLWNGQMWRRIWNNERCVEDGNGKTGSVKIREIPDWLRNWMLGNACQWGSLWHWREDGYKEAKTGLRKFFSDRAYWKWTKGRNKECTAAQLTYRNVQQYNWPTVIYSSTTDLP